MTPTRSVLIVGGLAESLINFRGDLIQTLLACGLQIHAAAPELVPTSPSGRRLASWGAVPHPVRLERTGVNPMRDARTALDLYRLCRKLRPDYLIAYTAKPVIYGLLAARLARVPHSMAMVTGLGYAFTEDASGSQRRLLRSVLHHLYRSALRGARQVVFQNPDDRALFVELGLVEPERCRLVYGSGINLETFAVAALPPLGPGIRFLLIARLLRDKGIYEFVEAARQVRARYPAAQFHIVGWSDSNPAAIADSDLQAWIADGSIVYHGQLQDVRPAIAQCHCYVLPSYREGTPRTVLEAMAMGRPIITTDVPGCRQTVEDGKSGYLVPAQNAPALAEAMLRLLANPERIAPMGAAARQLAVERFDVVQVNQRLLAFMGLESAPLRPGREPVPTGNTSRPATADGRH